MPGTKIADELIGNNKYSVIGVETTDEEIHVYGLKERGVRRCARCGARALIGHGTVTRKFRHVPFGSKPVFLVLTVAVWRCQSCGAVRQESWEVAAPRKRRTRAFANYVVELSRKMTDADVADHLGVSEALVRKIVTTELTLRMKRRSLKRVRRISIDEVARRKGRKYLTVVVDLDTGLVLYAADGRDAACLEPFFKRLKTAGAKLKAVAVDMAASYRSAFEQYAPDGAVLVNDRFHVVQRTNKAFRQLIAAMSRKIAARGGTPLSREDRFLLLGAREKVRGDEEKRARLDRLLADDELLKQLYGLKEDIRSVWALDGKEEAEAFLRDWLVEAREMKLRAMTVLANTIEAHIDSITAWYDCPVSTGPQEGLNNKIGALRRRSYGFRNPDSFALRVLNIHLREFNRKTAAL